MRGKGRKIADVLRTGSGTQCRWKCRLLSSFMGASGEHSAPDIIISAEREEEFPEHVEQCAWRQLAPAHRTCLPFTTSAAQGVCRLIVVWEHRQGGPSSVLLRGYNSGWIVGGMGGVCVAHAVMVLSASPPPPLTYILYGNSNSRGTSQPLIPTGTSFPPNHRLM